MWRRARPRYIYRESRTTLFPRRCPDAGPVHLYALPGPVQGLRLYAIREVVLGWLEGAPEGADEQTKYFTSLGLACDSAAALVNFISVNGHVLKQLGANPVAEALARSLHTAAWFQLPADTHLLVTRTGGRQGCKLGAVLFNMVYSVALRRVTAALAERGIVTRITTSGAGPFWGGAQSEWHWGSDHGVPFVEITYVDDEAIMIASRSPAALEAAYRLPGDPVPHLRRVWLRHQLGRGQNRVLRALPRETCGRALAGARCSARADPSTTYGF